jgi:hypothetical protein
MTVAVVVVVVVVVVVGVYGCVSADTSQSMGGWMGWGGGGGRSVDRGTHTLTPRRLVVAARPLAVDWPNGLGRRRKRGKGANPYAMPP